MTAIDFIIDVQNICKSFHGKQVVKGVTIQMRKGEIYGFLGPNGSGKTTTIRMICGLLTPDSGIGKCLGLDLRADAELIKQQVGYMTQKFSYWEDLTIKENLEFSADMFGVKDKKTVIFDTLEKLGLTHRQNQLAGSLSGGWKQRLALAACTLHKPKILLLDEPTAGVDPNARREFWDEIHKLAHNGITVLVSTHYMDEAERCHKIIYISDGAIITQGTVNEVIEQTGLYTWIIKGDNLEIVAKHLSTNKNHIIATFGDSLHLSGNSQEALIEALEPYFKDYCCQEIKPSLEDAFIYYMNKEQ